MKNENIENLENQPDSKTSDTSGKSKKKSAKPQKAKKDVNGVQLPVLVEFMYTISVLLLIGLASTIIVTSLLTGASLLALVIRTGVAMLVMGGLLTLISSQVSSGLLFSSLVEQEEHENAQSKKFENLAGIEEQSKVEVS